MVKSKSCLSSMTLEELIKCQLEHGREVNPSIDLTMLKKTISIRQSAQRSRNKKALYVREMEKKVTDLQATIASLSPEIENCKHNQNVLMMENSLLLQHLDTFTHKSHLLKVEMEEMQLELKRLKELYEAQKFQQLVEYEQREQELQYAGMTTNLENNWGMEQYLNMDLWGNSVFNP